MRSYRGMGGRRAPPPPVRQSTASMRKWKKERCTRRRHHGDCGSEATRGFPRVRARRATGGGRRALPRPSDEACVARWRKLHGLALQLCQWRALGRPRPPLATAGDATCRNAACVYGYTENARQKKMRKTRASSESPGGGRREGHGHRRRRHSPERHMCIRINGKREIREVA